MKKLFLNFICIISILLVSAGMVLSLDESTLEQGAGMLMFGLAAFIYASRKLKNKKKDNNTLIIEVDDEDINEIYNKPNDRDEYDTSDIDEIYLSETEKKILEDREKRIEEQMQRSEEYRKESNNPAFHRTDEEETMIANFSVKYNRLISQKNTIYFELRTSAYQGDKTYSEQIAQLELAKEYLKNMKNYFYSMGLAGKLFFMDTYEHLHSSTIDCYSEFDSLDWELERLKNKEIEYNRIHHEFIPSLLRSLVDSSEGILQKDLYPQYDYLSRNTIMSTVKKLEADGKIIKTKKGSTYLLQINN